MRIGKPGDSPQKKRKKENPDIIKKKDFFATKKIRETNVFRIELFSSDIARHLLPFPPQGILDPPEELRHSIKTILFFAQIPTKFYFFNCLV